MNHLKRNYWAATLGSFLNISGKLFLLVVSIFLILKSNQVADTFFTVITYVILALSLIWISGINYFLQKIFIGPKQDLIISNFLFFKTTIPLKAIKSIRVFQTFFDKKFNTFSLKVSFLDEDEDDDEIIFHGFDISSLKLLKAQFKDKLNSIPPDIFPKKLQGAKLMKSTPENRISLEVLEKRFKQMWLFNIVLMVLLVILFVFLIMNNQYNLAKLNVANPISKGELSSNMMNTNKLTFNKVFVFPQNSSMEPLYIYRNQDGKFVVNLAFPDELYKTAKNVSIILRNKNTELINYSFDFLDRSPVGVSGMCLKPGVVETSGDQELQITLGYYFDEMVCANPDNVVLDFNAKGSTLRLVGALKS